MDRRYRIEEEIRQCLRKLSDAEKEGYIESGGSDIDYEPENVEKEDTSTDSDQSLLEDDDDESVEEMPLEGDDLAQLRFYLGRDKETLWVNDSKYLKSISQKTRPKNIVRILPGPKGAAQDAKTPLDAFLQIINLQMVDELVKHTNISIIRIHQKRRLQWDQQSKVDGRDRDFRLTNREEIMALIGALFMIACKKSHCANVRELWTIDGTGLLILRANFSFNRFLLLLRCLRFDNVTTRAARQKSDKLAPIRDFHSQFVKNCQNSYNLGELTTIGEMLVAFRGRCSFTQYMPQKPAKYGIKMYSIVDSETFYTHTVEIYCGKQPEGPYFGDSNKPVDIVKRLIDPLKMSNRNLTTDNYYSSIPLAKYLLESGMTFLGTLKRNKKEIPPEFVSDPSRKIGSSLFGFQNDMSLVSFVTKRKKAVILLSTLHDTAEIDPELDKPLIILDYNMTKGGVDSVDQMCSTLSTARKTRRWPMVVFFRQLDVAGINSYKIYTTNVSRDNYRRRHYLNELAQMLMEPNLRIRAMNWRLPKDIQLFLSKYKESPVVPSNINSAVQRGICYLCGSHKNNRTSLACEKCSRKVCKKHCKLSVICGRCQGDKAEETED